MQLKVLLADDHTIFRQGISALIEKHNLGTVIGEAGDGVEAVRLTGEMMPDLVIMDIGMLNKNGIDATREITAAYPSVRVIVLSAEDGKCFVIDALTAGASGYLLKDSLVEELAEAIDVVMRGEVYLPSRIATIVARQFLQCVPHDMGSTYQNLTARERQILQMVADGKSIKEIAWELGTSNKTVENQRQAVMNKLNLFSVAELTKFAVRHGLTTLNIT